MKKVIIVILIMALVFVATACDTAEVDILGETPEADESREPNSTPETSETTETTEAPAPVVLAAPHISDIDMSTITGLPVNPFRLGDRVDFDWFNESPPMRYYNFHDFLVSTVSRELVFAKVADIEVDAVHTSARQVTFEILAVVWGRGAVIPESMTLRHVHYFDDVNEFHQDGVYLIPISHDYTQNRFYYKTEGTLDVMFQVDDQGRVWSHSSHEGFNQFDGEDVSVIVGAINDLTAHPHFDLALTTFGKAVRDYALTDITVHSVEEHRRDNGVTVNLVTFDAKFLSTPTDAYPWWNLNDRVIVGECLSSAGLHSIIAPFESGERYLVFLPRVHYAGREQSISPLWGASVRSDGTISGLNQDAPYVRPFVDFEGFTIDEIIEQTEFVREWYALHA
jgi:hypothetical protein